MSSHSHSGEMAAVFLIRNEESNVYNPLIDNYGERSRKEWLQDIECKTLTG